MSIPTPDSGDVIQKQDVIDVHENVRSMINALGQSTIGRHALGPQHMPGCTVGKGTVEVTTAYEVIHDLAGGPPSHHRTAETIADIQSGNWLTLSDYDLDNSGAGYTLPPCKVLVFFNCRVSEFVFQSDDIELWVNVHHSINGAEVYDQRHSGMIFQYGGLQSPGEQPISIAFLIDQTGAGGNWTLDHIRAKAALARGNFLGTAKSSAKILNGSMSFIAFYKDE